MSPAESALFSKELLALGRISCDNLSDQNASAKARTDRANAESSYSSSGQVRRLDPDTGSAARCGKAVRDRAAWRPAARILRPLFRRADAGPVRKLRPRSQSQHSRPL